MIKRLEEKKWNSNFTPQMLSAELAMYAFEIKDIRNRLKAEYGYIIITISRVFLKFFMFSKFDGLFQFSQCFVVQDRKEEYSETATSHKEIGCHEVLSLKTEFLFLQVLRLHNFKKIT